ncbi:ABC transporter substrate-binding protein [Schaalia suimastitidis]|uniref:ABC transporter substrate-binding protein n=1 Tax=Schaalia suimastitidis TaxID=121163 RepID=UPI00040FDA15|nr:sugar ABC transporter substrate-binding protein [Schaalia suimastitidis]
MSTRYHRTPTTGTARSTFTRTVGMTRKGRSPRRWSVLAGTAAASLTLAACSTLPLAGDNTVVLNYWLWDSAQLPGYRQCAAAFQEENPDIEVQITQFGWGDYWMQITATMVAEAAPDVFTNHTGQFGKYAELGQLLDLEPYIERDNFDLSIYNDGLADQWLNEAGTGRYGIPKDWDTEALFYNEEMIAEAGYTSEDLWNLTWNPQDGGSFEALIAHLTVDKNGVRGDEPGFDKNNVAVYGMGYNEAGAGYGQVQWSAFALSNGQWTWSDKNPWGRTFQYDDPDFKETISWYIGLIEKGYMPPLSVASSGIGTLESLGTGAYAMIVEGSWNVAGIAKSSAVPVQVAPTPIGPDGNRASVMNGLADSVFVGTKHPEEAWEWVKFLGSTKCQDIIAEQAVVFPAISSSSDKAVDAFEKIGFDATAFSVHIEDGTGVPSPVVDRWAALDSIMNPAMSAIFMFEKDVDSLDQATAEVNAMMSRGRQ